MAKKPVVNAPHPTDAPEPKPRVVSGVAAASISNSKKLSRRIEEAMSTAVTQAAADGVTDPVKVKARMMAAREKVRKEMGLS